MLINYTCMLMSYAYKTCRDSFSQRNGIILLPSLSMTVCHGGRTRVYIACGAASAVFCSREQVTKRVDSCEAGRYT